MKKKTILEVINEKKKLKKYSGMTIPQIAKDILKPGTVLEVVGGNPNGHNYGANGTRIIVNENVSFNSNEMASLTRPKRDGSTGNWIYYKNVTFAGSPAELIKARMEDLQAAIEVELAELDGLNTINEYITANKIKFPENGETSANETLILHVGANAKLSDDAKANMVIAITGLLG